MNLFLNKIFCRMGGMVTVTIRSGRNAGLKWTAFPHSGYWRGGAEEADTVNAIEKHTSNGSVCFDVGAHFGYYSLMMARRVGAEGAVYAFEPEPFSFGRLKKHIALNGPQRNCTALNLAASDSNGSGRMNTGGNPGVTTAHFRYPDEPAFDGSVAVDVRLAKIDSLVESGELRSPHFVKVDVEGHAGAALSGMTRSIDLSRPVVLVSIHGNDEAAAVAELFASRGYRSFYSVSGKTWEGSLPCAEERVLMLP